MKHSDTVTELLMSQKFKNLFRLIENKLIGAHRSHATQHKHRFFKTSSLLTAYTLFSYYCFHYRADRHASCFFFLKRNLIITFHLTAKMTLSEPPMALKSQ